MADTSSPRRSQLSRLQRRAPSSIQTKRSSSSLEWNVAIPLLSPIASSPPSNLIFDQKTEIECSGSEKAAATAAVKKWLHPAAPFYYEPKTSSLAAAPFVIRVDGS